MSIINPSSVSPLETSLKNAGQVFSMMAAPLHTMENTIHESVMSSKPFDSNKISSVLMAASLQFETIARVTTAGLEAHRQIMNMQI